MANGLLGCTKFRCISRTTKTTNLVQDVLRQFHVLQFCHVHGHDLATGSDGEGQGQTVRLFVFLLSLVEQERSLSLSLSLSLAVTIDTDDAAGTRCGGGSDAASLCR